MNPVIQMDISVKGGGDLFSNIEKLRELHRKKQETLDKLAVAILHHKKRVPDDDVDPNKFAWCERSIQELRKIYRVVADPYWSPRSKNAGVAPESITNNNQLKIDRENMTLTFTIPMNRNIHKVLVEQTLSFGQAKHLISYLARRLTYDTSMISWFKNNVLAKWEKPEWQIPKKEEA